MQYTETGKNSVNVLVKMLYNTYCQRKISYLYYLTVLVPLYTPWNIPKTFSIQVEFIKSRGSTILQVSIHIQHIYILILITKIKPCTLFNIEIKLIIILYRKL